MQVLSFINDVWAVIMAWIFYHDVVIPFDTHKIALFTHADLSIFYLSIIHTNNCYLCYSINKLKYQDNYIYVIYWSEYHGRKKE